MWRLALLILVLTGCGAPCPKPATADQDVVIAPTPAPVSCPDDGDEPPPVVKPLPRDTSFAGYDGRWFFMEPEGDEVELVIEIHGARGTIRKIGDEKSQPIRIERQPNGLALIVIQQPGGGDAERGYLLPRGTHSLSAFEFGDDKALLGRREGPVPSWFRGQWTLSRLRGRGPFSLEFDGKQGQMTRNGKTHQLDIRGMNREGAMYDLVVQRKDARREEDVAWLRISEVEPGVYLVFEGNEEEFVVMHRPGAKPRWVEEATRTATSGMRRQPPIRPPTPVKPPAPAP